MRFFEENGLALLAAEECRHQLNRGMAALFRTCVNKVRNRLKRVAR